MKQFVLALSLFVITISASAFTRAIPESAKTGVFSPSALPTVVIDGNTVTTTPALRIYNRQNLIVQPVALVSEPDLKVRYTVNAMGQVEKIWILTPEEKRALKE